jgi:alkanesulfonate monooxygenase SsuD/methylene tetrahydromethanopterin reductase-like flavin-dependent oxidoreductase (luciferase family)
LINLSMRLDFRAPFDDARPELFAAALEITKWADAVGFDSVMFPEHHGWADGYNPSPIVAAAAHAAVTKRLGIALGALLLPYHDPIRVAEDLAVLDHICAGRLRFVLVGSGYVPDELAMFRVPPRERGAMLAASVAVLNHAWTGEPFEHHGTTIRVTPTPFTRPRPRLLIGGSSKAMARRAARLEAAGHADGFSGDTHDNGAFEAYVEERARLGLPPLPDQPAYRQTRGSLGVYVAEDPERAWQEVGPYLLDDNVAYYSAIKQAAEAAPGRRTPFRAGAFSDARDVDALRSNPRYAIVTPQECIDLAHETGFLRFAPLCGGLRPELAWRSLELFESRVLPALLAHDAEAPGVVPWSTPGRS